MNQYSVLEPWLFCKHSVWSCPTSICMKRAPWPFSFSRVFSTVLASPDDLSPQYLLLLHPQQYSQISRCSMVHFGCSNLQHTNGPWIVPSMGVFGVNPPDVLYSYSNSVTMLSDRFYCFKVCVSEDYMNAALQLEMDPYKVDLNLSCNIRSRNIGTFCLYY